MECRPCLSMTTVILFWVAIQVAECISRNSRGCEILHCPETCNLTFRDGCPHNCNCKPLRYDCPDIYCPFAFPTCLIRTKPEGCQECACPGQNGELVQERLGPNGPVIFSTKPQQEKSNVSDKIIGASPSRGGQFHGLESENRNPNSETAKKAGSLSNFAPKSTSSPSSSSTSQQSLFQSSNFGSVSNSNFPAPVPPPFIITENKPIPIPPVSISVPVSNLSPKQFALPTPFSPNSIGSRTTVTFPIPPTTVSPTRPARTQPPQRFNPPPRITQAPFRPVPPTVRFPSVPTQFIPIHQAPKPRPNGVPSLSEIMYTNTCNEVHQGEIDRHLGDAVDLVEGRKHISTPAFPFVYSMPVEDLRDACAVYKRGMRSLNGKSVRVCRTRYAPFDSLISTFEVPCGYGTHAEFIDHLDCLSSQRFDPKVTQCESRSTPTCPGYSQLVDCIFEPVRGQCGPDAWEIHYQYLSLYARQFDSICQVRRIFRRVAAVNKT